MLLAIDTSGGTVVSLLDPSTGVCAVRELDDARRHAEVIGPFLAEVCAELGVSARAIEQVVVGMGPGPFTGLRIGIAAARAFAAARALVLLPVVSHDAIAHELLPDAAPAAVGTGAAAAAPVAPTLLVSTDARRNEVFFSRYQGRDAEGLPLRIAGPELGRFEALPEVEEHSVNRTVSGRALAELGWLHGRRGRPGPAQALYLRSPDVTLSPAKGVTG